MLEDLQRLFKHGGVYLVGNLLNRLGAFLLLPLYTRFLSVAEFGVIELLFATIAIVSVLLSAGLSHTTLRFYFDKKEEAARARVVSTNLVMVGVLGLAGAAALSLLSPRLSQVLFDTPAYARALDICLALMVLEMMSEIGFAYLRAREQSGLYVIISFLRLLLQVSLSLYLVGAAGMGVMGVVLANLASVALVWLIVCGYVASRCGLAVDRALLGPMFRYSLPMAGTGLVGAVMLNIDRVLLKEMLSLDAVGLYGLALKFAMLLTFLVAEPFYRAYGPFRFSILDKPNAADIQATVVNLLVAGAGTVALAIALFMPEVLHFITTPAFEPAAAFVPILLVAGVVSAATYCFETGILVKKQTQYLFYVSLANLLAKIALNLAFIPLLGIHGATLAFLASALIRAFLVNRVSQRLMPVTYDYGAMLRVLVLAGAAFAAAQPLDPTNWRVTVPLKAVVLVVFIVILVVTDARLRTAAGALRERLSRRMSKAGER